MSISIIFTNLPQICCIAGQVKSICTATSKYCNRLLQNVYIAIIIWILGIEIMVLNAMSLSYSFNMFYQQREHFSKKAKVYRILVIYVNCSDSIVGFYLVILGVIDVVFTDIFVEIFGFWRQSFYCLTVASISLLCMSYSFWGMFLIGLFRFIAIKFPIKSVLRPTSLKLILISFSLGSLIFIIGMYCEQFYYKNKFRMTILCFLFRDQQNVSFTLADYTIDSYFIILTVASLILYIAIFYELFRSSETLMINNKQTNNKQSQTITRYLTFIYMTNTIFYFLTSVLYFKTIFSQKNEKNNNLQYDILCNITSYTHIFLTKSNYLQFVYTS